MRVLFSTIYSPCARSMAKWQWNQPAALDVASTVIPLACNSRTSSTTTFVDPAYHRLLRTTHPSKMPNAARLGEAALLHRFQSGNHGPSWPSVCAPLLESLLVAWSPPQQVQPQDLDKELYVEQ